MTNSRGGEGGPPSSLPLAVEKSALLPVAFAELLWFATLVVACWDTVLPMVTTWISSETYTHGIVVAPISAWLVWRMRFNLLPRLQAGPSFSLVLALILACSLHVAGELMLVQVVAQFALAAMLVIGCAALLGLSASRIAIFPLLFLFMMVPVGSSLEPIMMDMTAKYTVQLIQMTGIPVYQEGRFFELPTGSWSVVEACSGVRYLIASFTLGLIYAHLNYRTLGKKLFFVVLSFVVPVVANIVRAYLIVMLGHLSGMELATGVDHLIYGWIFFGIVMLLLFWVGGFWADPDPMVTDFSDDDALLKGRSTQHQGKSYAGRLWGCLAIISTMAIVTAIIPQSLGRGSSETELGPLVATTGDGWNCAPSTRGRWAPRATDVDRRVVFACEGARRTTLYADQYLDQTQGREVSRFATGLKGEDGDRWRVLASGTTTIFIGESGALQAEEFVLRRNKTGEAVLVWLWYQVNERAIAGASEVKLAELLALLQGDYRVSSRVYLGMPVSGEGDYAAAREAGRDLLAASGEALALQLSADASR